MPVAPTCVVILFRPTLGRLRERGFIYMPEAVTEATVMAALRQVEDPELHRDIVSLNMVRDLKVGGDVVSMTLIVTMPGCPLAAAYKNSVETALHNIPEASTTNVSL